MLRLKRESFASRIGFLMVSAGCAIGIGNVWRFPTVTGQYGGGVFVLFYLLFLVLMGAPVLTMELAVGRAGHGSAGTAHRALEPKGSKWHLHGWACLIGCCVLMMYYTTVSGWMLAYFFRFVKGTFTGLAADAVSGVYADLLADPFEQIVWMAITVLLGFFVCSRGLQNGIERIGKWMMGALFVLILVLAVHSFCAARRGRGPGVLPAAGLEPCRRNGHWQCHCGCHEPGVLYPQPWRWRYGNLWQLHEPGLYPGGRVPAYLRAGYLRVGHLFRPDHLPGLLLLRVSPDAGPKLIFITLPNVFANMTGGRLWGTLFFVFMTFASFSTIIAVFQNILACLQESFGWSLKRACAVGTVFILLASVPCILGFNLWSGVQPMGPGSTVLDAEDFLVSNLLLPIGSLIYLLFCVTRWGWGFDNYLTEANTGKGLRLPRWFKPYFSVVLPLLIVFILVQGL